RARGPYARGARHSARSGANDRADLSVAVSQNRSVRCQNGVRIRAMTTPITNIEDLRVLARRRVPKALFEYVDGGSYDELTLRANRADLDAVKLRQRVLIDTSKR